MSLKLDDLKEKEFDNVYEEGRYKASLLVQQYDLVRDEAPTQLCIVLFDLLDRIKMLEQKVDQLQQEVSDG